MGGVCLDSGSEDVSENGRKKWGRKGVEKTINLFIQKLTLFSFFSEESSLLDFSQTDKFSFILQSLTQTQYKNTITPTKKTASAKRIQFRFVGVRSPIL